MKKNTSQELGNALYENKVSNTGNNLVFNPQTGKLRSGTSGKIVIPKTLNDIFIIPQKATFSQQDKVLVYKLENDSVKQQVISVQSTPDGQNYAVTNGLSDGDTIVYDGIATLRNGMKILIKESLTASY